MKVAGERTVDGRRLLLLESVPGKWKSSDPGSRATALVDALTYESAEIASILDDGLFQQTVTTRVVETLDARRAVVAKLAMSTHARCKADPHRSLSTRRSRAGRVADPDPQPSGVPAVVQAMVQHAETTRTARTTGHDHHHPPHRPRRRDRRRPAGDRRRDRPERQTRDAAMTVGPRTIISGQDPSPVDFPGLRGDRPGRPLPSGYAAVGYRVSITRGAVKALPTFVVRCPAGQAARDDGRLRGAASPRRSSASRRSCAGARSSTRAARAGASWWTIDPRGVATGQTVSGTVYGLCR